jgi:hypothetical protein
LNAASLVTIGTAFGAAFALTLSIGAVHGISQATRSNFPNGYYAKAGVALAENQADKDAAKAAEHQNASHPQDPTVQDDPQAQHDPKDDNGDREKDYSRSEKQPATIPKE